MINHLTKIYTFIIITIPITSQYKSFIPGISIGDLFLLLSLPFAIYIFSYYGWDIKKTLENPFIWLAIYIIVGSLISVLFQQVGYSITDILVRSIRYIFYIFCAVVISNLFFNFKYAMRWYGRLVLFATIYLILQVILYRTNGIFLTGTIPGLDLANELYDFEKSKILLANFFRPYSIFIEPGYYSQFVIPYLAYCLFKKNDESKPQPEIFKAVFITVGIVLSTSGQGLILGAVIWVIWFIMIIYDFENHKLRLIPIILGIIFISIIPFILQNGEIQTSINRLFGSPEASANLRIYRGFAVFEQLDFLYMMFGVGYGNPGSFITYNGIYTIYDIPQMPDYMNSVAYVLVSSGIIGLIIILFAFIYMFINTRGFFRICILILLILSLGGNMLLSSNMILYISIILSGFNRIYKNDIS